MVFAVTIAAVENVGRIMRNKATFAEHDGQIFDVGGDPIIQAMGLFAPVGHTFGELVGERLYFIIGFGFVVRAIFIGFRKTGEILE